MRDPELNSAGTAQCDEFRESFKDDSQYITHILSSPLSRCLDTARLALKDVLAKPVKIVPMPELQTLGGGPNGTGKSVSELKERYGTADELTFDEGQIAEQKPLFDWRFIREDWIFGKDGAGNDIWGAGKVEWRKNYVTGFLRGIIMAKEPKERVEILLVGNGSFFRILVGPKLYGTGTCFLENLSSHKIFVYADFVLTRSPDSWKGTNIRSFKFGARRELEEVSKEELIELRNGSTQAGGDA